jgi:carboxyl-terminal processing protease
VTSGPFSLILKSMTPSIRSKLPRLVLVVALLAFPAFGASKKAPAKTESNKEESKDGKKEEKKVAKDLSREKYENIELFQKIYQFIQANYVDEVGDKQLIEGAIKGMMETLDPHSSFLTADIYRDMKTDTSGRFGGLGIEIGMKNDGIVVVAPMEDTPAWRAGVKSGDRILKINGESTKGLSLVEAVAKMRGKKGGTVTMTLGREGVDKPFDVKLARETIKIQSVKSESLPDGFGYIRLASFNEDAGRDVRRALEKLEKDQKLKGLVFDLRMNPGGLLDQAVDVASVFMDEGVVVSTIGRDPAQKEVRLAKKGWARKDIPVAVLVNSGSASASEIVAGALQDSHRAIVMGQPTFGKGSVQTVVDLGNDLGMKLTIARYYTPSGRSIQEKGIQPDIILDDCDPKVLAKARTRRETFRERDLRRHLKNPLTDVESEEAEVKETAAKSDEPARFNPKDDEQVRQAVNYLKSFELFKKVGQAPSQNGSG